MESPQYISLNSSYMSENGIRWEGVCYYRGEYHSDAYWVESTQKFVEKYFSRLYTLGLVRFFKEDGNYDFFYVSGESVDIMSEVAGIPRVNLGDEEGSYMSDMPILEIFGPDGEVEYAIEIDNNREIASILSLSEEYTNLDRAEKLVTL